MNPSGNFIDALQLLINASESFPAIQAFVMAISILIGVVMVGVSLIDMYHMAAYSGGSNWSGSQAPTPAGVLSKMFIGGILATSAYWMYIGGNTLVGTNVSTSSMLYGGVQNTACDRAQYAVFFFVALVGQIAFVRGWIYVNRYMNNSRSEGLGMGVTFIVGGILCYFLADVGQLLAEWLGINMSLQVFCS